MTAFSIFFVSIGTILAISVVIGIARLLFYSQRAVVAGRRAVPVSNSPQNAQARILVIGDSTSYGTGAQSPENSLVGRLINDYPSMEVVNASENSMDLKRLHSKLVNMQNGRFDIAIIHIGGMDTITFTRSEIIQNYVKKIDATLREMGVRTVILVSMNNVGALPIGFFPLDKIYDRRSFSVTDIFMKACSECDMVHIPLYTPLDEEPLHTGPYFSQDKMHPNDAGYGLWYMKIKTIIHPHLQT